jgi:hypothetical protein
MAPLSEKWTEGQGIIINESDIEIHSIKQYWDEKIYCSHSCQFMKLVIDDEIKSLVEYSISCGFLVMKEFREVLFCTELLNKCG